jgi:hypothetical protein
MSEPIPNPDLARLEAALKGLAPSPGRLSHDRLLFAAGRAAALRWRWLWPAATAVLAVVAAGLGTALFLRPGPLIVERVVKERVPVPVPPAPQLDPDDEPDPAPPPLVTPAEPERVASAAPGSYLEMRNQVIRWGADALPRPAAVATPAPAPEPRDRRAIDRQPPMGLFPLFGGW